MKLVRLTGAAVTDPLTAAVALVAPAVGLWGRVNSAWLIAAGVAVGLVHAVAA